MPPINPLGNNDKGLIVLIPAPITKFLKSNNTMETKYTKSKVSLSNA